MGGSALPEILRHCQSASQSISRPSRANEPTVLTQTYSKMQRLTQLSRVLCNIDRHFAFNKILLYPNHVSATLSGTSLKEDADSAQLDDRYDTEIPKTRPEPQGTVYDSRSRRVFSVLCADKLQRKTDRNVGTAILCALEAVP